MGLRHFLAQDVLEDNAAADYLQWLNWGLWLLLAACVLAVIAGGATMAISSSSGNAEGRAWGLKMIIAGLVGALAAGALATMIDYFHDLIVN